MIQRAIKNIHRPVLVLKKYTLTCINDKKHQSKIYIGLY